MNAGVTHALALYACVFFAGVVIVVFIDEDRSLPLASRMRARRLFLSKLTPGQRWSWFLRRRFATRAASGERYLIGAYESFNISTRDARYCLAVDGRVPNYDKLLAQKLLLESDEARFLSLANRGSTTRFARDKTKPA